jgi:DNA-binding NtrC family response regulator
MTAFEALRLGRFAEAVAALERGDLNDPQIGGILAEALYGLGHTERARTCAERTLLRTPDQNAASRCLSTLAALARDDGHVEESMVLYQRAVDAAQQAKDDGLVAASSIDLLERSFDRRGFDASLSLASVTRRAVTRVGDAQLSARLHISFGRLEARAGHLERARRHFDLGRKLLALAPNEWLNAAVDLDECALLILLGDVNGAMELALRGATASASSGWSRGKLVSAANLAHLFLSLGRLDEAEAQLVEARRQTFHNGNYDIVLADTSAQLAICSRQFERAESILREHEQRAQSFGPWYGFRLRHTLVRLLLMQSRDEEAREIASLCAISAAQAGNDGLLQAFRLSSAEAELPDSYLQSVSAVLTSSLQPESDLETIGTVYLILAKWFVGIRRLKAVALLGRARRVLAFAANRPLEISAENTAAMISDLDGGPATRSGPPTPPDLDSAVALIELAGHPHILGREAFAILEQAACCERLALVAVGPAGSRAIAVNGWSEAEALEAVGTAAAEELSVLGQHRDETWQLLARPFADLDHHCTVAAVRKLVATARNLDHFRRDEKQRAALWPAEALDGDPESLWASEQSAELVTIARRIATSPVPVLLTGETGTGKEMLARVIHRASERADRPWQPFNCSAVPREMLESQLFGYRRGAFTGADGSFPGVIRAAAGGTLFLDEIADMSLDVQPKLLRFLDYHEIQPLGEAHPAKVDVRIIAATNANLEQMVAEGRFREDLLYRLNVVRLRIPPLRERREEIPPLVQHYLRRFSDEQKKGRLSITDEVLEYLVLYKWTGNLRQLANEVKRLVAFADRDSTITPALLSPEILASRRTIAASPGEPEVRVRLDQPMPAAVEMLEQMMVRRALERAHGRVEEASRILGISRKGLFLKRRRWGLRQAS